jgi:hypothetical protein
MSGKHLVIYTGLLLLVLGHGNHSFGQSTSADGKGFQTLFNGRDLSGWKGLVKDPPSRAKMTAGELAAAQKEADQWMNAHWQVREGILYTDGGGENLCTEQEFENFELLVDFKIEPEGDSGVYLRGSPQVQIWDPKLYEIGSGGLYNNENHPSKPLETADRRIGEWNTLRIEMIEDKVTVWLNDRLVVDNTVLENYWESELPIYSSGSIELQSHTTPLYFRNISIKRLPKSPDVLIEH